MDFTPVTNQVSHFAINADDVTRARQFYEKAFGWTFEPFGPPGFYLIETGAKGPAQVRGALQGRRELVSGLKLHGFECTIAVADINATVAAVEAAGGRIVMQKCTLPGIGHLAFFQDTEGNVAGAMQYESTAE